ncbi:N-acetylglucosaminylphosphatidylinositol deacetylase [Malassezia vespertilionis]|uniref:N-acetylglucosaminylphosphatidylinositol deacetylase n=1 Tax=Malassezia vespertilionis TaxID=2020962 RepID=A0A2N1J9M7_9BASI|nr:N-acetylglucosaminylphosphatidylinositol deacetylase [Malassezia vespertilionis]PKI83260.1 Gpi12p [Malassezia vespertilionis]WFD07844.1 N-acetylglucosaminylphosphatidylinositol deacetylase [Malassezia vespertilionis]
MSAHPDDEVMFFAPAVLEMARQGVRISAWCLSQGNGDGLGAVRREELYQSYQALGVPKERVFVWDDVNLQDGMEHVWDEMYIRQQFIKLAAKWGDMDAILTFDAHGVSSHPNHVAVHRGALAVRAHWRDGVAPTLLTVRTPPLATKFTGLPGALIARLIGHAPILFMATPIQYISALRAMQHHATQLVWFRYLYVLFSTLMYANVIDVWN